MYLEIIRQEKNFSIKSCKNGAIVFLDKNGQALSDYPEELITQKCPLKSPIVVHLELTRRCGLNCKHCYISAGKPRQNELSTNEWKAILDQLKALEILSVYFTGGDPLLHEGCTELLAYARKLGLSCNLLTNGLELEKKGLLELIPREVFLVLSFDGLNGTSILRNIPGKRILRIVEKLSTDNRAFAIQGVVFKDNISEMIETMNWSLKNGIDFCTNGFYPIGRGKQNKNLLLREDQYIELLTLEEASRNYQENIVFKRPTHPFSNPDTYQTIEKWVKATKRPEPGLFVAYISSDGYIFPDNYYAGEDWGSKINLRQAQLSNVWTDAFELERKIIANDRINCTDCSLIKQSGHCNLQNMAMSQQLHGSANHYLFKDSTSLCQSGYITIHNKQKQTA